MLVATSNNLRLQNKTTRGGPTRANDEIREAENQHHLQQLSRNHFSRGSVYKVDGSQGISIDDEDIDTVQAQRVQHQLQAFCDQLHQWLDKQRSDLRHDDNKMVGIIEINHNIIIIKIVIDTNYNILSQSMDTPVCHRRGWRRQDAQSTTSASRTSTTSSISTSHFDKR